jgi:hypothetical protein
MSEWNLTSGARRIVQLVEVGYVDLGKAAGCRRVDCVYHTLDLWPKVRPLLLAEHDNGNFPPRKVLLITHIFVGGQKDIEPGLFRCRQQFAVFELAPALLKSGADRVPFNLRSRA